MPVSSSIRLSSESDAALDKSGGAREEDRGLFFFFFGLSPGRGMKNYPKMGAGEIRLMPERIDSLITPFLLYSNFSFPYYEISA